MRIALTHNLQISEREEEAEFDRPETIAALRGALERLGHVVEPVEVSGPASRTVARLEAWRPDLIFNTAEGRRGRFREAFYPALFDELGIPYTGSDAYVCALTLDKHLTKTVVATAGVPVPKSIFVAEPGRIDASGLRFPVIVKPNYEGSSKGIDQDSVVEDLAQLQNKVGSLLDRYASGVLVEEYIVGRDVAVPFLETADTPFSGVLDATEYVFDERALAGRKYPIYDYALKQREYMSVSVRCPAELDEELEARLKTLSLAAFRTLGVRDLGRIDYRVTPDGRAYFLEVNALPSLEPGAGIYDSAARAGLDSVERVLGAVVESAARRQGVRPSKSKGRRGTLTVGLAFNLKRTKPQPGGIADEEAEYDAPATIAAIKEAIASFGHEVVELEADADFPTKVAASGVDVVFNLAEGIQGRSRESQVPALLELVDIPYTGSDPTSLSLALDKGLAKRIVRQAGVHTPDFVSLTTGRERIAKDFAFPAIVKPVAEGSSKGVIHKSVVENEQEMRDVAREMIDKYRQPALVETYLPGREFTLGLLGERRPRVLPPMEIVFLDPTVKHPTYTFDDKLEYNDKVRYEIPAKVDDVLLKDLERVGRRVFGALGCRDVARVDVRLDAKGHVHFIECNPLPGLTPGWSDLCLIANGAGMDYRTLIGEILAPAIRRLRHRERERSQAGERVVSPR